MIHRTGRRGSLFPPQSLRHTRDIPAVVSKQWIVWGPSVLSPWPRQIKRRRAGLMPDRGKLAPPVLPRAADAVREQAQGAIRPSVTSVAERGKASIIWL